MLTSNKIQNNINHTEEEVEVEWRQLENKQIYSSSPLISRTISSSDGNTLFSSVIPLSLSTSSFPASTSLSSSATPVIRQEAFYHRKLYNNRPKQLNLNTSSLNIGWTQSPSCTNSYSREFYCLFDCTNINDEDKGELLNSEEKLSNSKRPTATNINITSNNNKSTNHSTTSDISNAYNLFSRLINHAINGQLRVCRFRSICWRIFLGILPNDVNNWSKQLKTDREYFAKLNYHINPDPHNINNQYKLNDHPLSSNITSSWNKYFYSLQIKRSIAKDVDRTFPNIQYFRNQNIRDIMINLLYIYTEHQNISYEQGMHEILAPLLFVLHCDLIAFEHVQEMNLISTNLWNTLNYVLNREYFQADVYTMFAKIMNSIKHWYPQSKLTNNNPINLNNSNNNDNNVSNNKEKRVRRLTSVELASIGQENTFNQSQERKSISRSNSNTSNDNNSNYFQLYYDYNELEDQTINEAQSNHRRESNTDDYYQQRQQDPDREDEYQKSGFYFNEKEHSKHNCSGYCYVDEIHKQLLQKYHIKLYKHLKQLDIEPKLFGLRWIRLLFGHEFPLQDLLYIWDCLFAINDNLAFVPYMYLSMLLRLAPLLLKYEFAECLTLLMNYPTGIDVTYLVYFALHLYKPQLYYKPTNAYHYYIDDDSSNNDNDENHNNIHMNTPQSNHNTSHRNSQCNNNDTNNNNNNMDYKDKSSIVEKTKNMNSISYNYKKFNSVLSLPCIRDKIRMKIQNTPLLNRSISYRETENTNHTTTTTDKNNSSGNNNNNNKETIVSTIKRSKSFKDYEQSLMHSRGVFVADLLSIQKLNKNLTVNNENASLLNNNSNNESNLSVNDENDFHNRKMYTSCSSVNLNHEPYKTNSSSKHTHSSVFTQINKNHDPSNNYTDLHLSVPQLNNSLNSIHYNEKTIVSNLTTSLSNLFTNYITTKSTGNNQKLETSGIKYPSLSSVYNSSGMINMMKNINNHNYNDNSTDSSFMDTIVQPINRINHLPKSLTDSCSSSLNIEDIQDNNDNSNNNELNEETHLLIGNCIKSLSMCATHLDMYFNNPITQDKNDNYRKNSLQASSFFTYPSSSITETIITDFQNTYQPSYNSYQFRRNSSHPVCYSTRSSISATSSSSISPYSMHLYDQALFTDFDHLKYIQSEIKTTLDNLIKFLYNHMDIPEELTTDPKLIDPVKQINNIEVSNLLTNSFNDEISITSQNDELQLLRTSRTLSSSLSSPVSARESTSASTTATSPVSPTHF